MRMPPISFSNVVIWTKALKAFFPPEARCPRFDVDTLRKTRFICSSLLHSQIEGSRSPSLCVDGSGSREGKLSAGPNSLPRRGGLPPSIIICGSCRICSYPLLCRDGRGGQSEGGRDRGKEKAVRHNGCSVLLSSAHIRGAAVSERPDMAFWHNTIRMTVLTTRPFLS